MNVQVQIERRQKNWGPACRYLASNRNSKFKDIPFERFIPLAFHATVPQLQAANLEELVSLVCQINQSDLYSDWQRYCKSLHSEEQKAIATLEGALHFAAESVTSLEYRELWKSSYCSLLRDLEILQTASGDRKRKREDDENSSSRSRGSKKSRISDVCAEFTHISQTENLQRKTPSTIPPLLYYQETFYTIVLTKVSAFEGILGRRLYEEVVRNRLMPLGDPVVQLHMPEVFDQDCVLQVSVSISTAKTILDAANGSFELIDTIGRYLFQAMMKSKLSESDSGLRGTIHLDGHDLFMAIDFMTGKHMMNLEAQGT